MIGPPTGGDNGGPIPLALKGGDAAAIIRLHGRSGAAWIFN